jgi:photosystem II stability/assembly factor-like uncharacterized protein
MKLSTCFAAIAVLLTTVATAQWERVEGFDNGGVNGLHTSGDYLVASSLGGIYRTTNPANGWQRVTNGDESEGYGRLYGFGDELFAISFFGGMPVRSTDHGATWTAVDLGPNTRLNQVAKAGNLYFGIGLSTWDLYTSTDGIEWSTMSSDGLPSFSDICSDGEYIYLYGWGQGMYRTNDLENFEQVLGDMQAGTVIVADGALVVQGSGLRLSTDHGSSWITLEGEDGFGVTGGALLGAALYDNKWIITLNSPNSGTYVSDDEGASWTFTPYASVNHPQEHYSEFNGALYGSSMLATVSRAIIDGTAWSYESQGAGIDASAVPFLANAGSDFYGVRPVSSYLSMGSNFDNPTFTSNFFDFGLPEFTTVQFVERFDDGAMLHVPFGTPGLLVRKHGDAAFSEMTGNLFTDFQFGFSIRWPQFLGGTLVIFSNAGELIYTEDGGQTWQSAGESAFNVSRPVWRHNNLLFGLAGINGNQLYRTDDLGQTYELVAEVPVNSPTYSFSNGERMMVANQEQRAYSDDGGETWTAVSNDGFYQRYAYIRNSGSSVVALGFQSPSIIMVSHDMGETFEEGSAEGLPEYMPLNANIIHNNQNIGLHVPGGNIYHIPRAALGIATSVGERVVARGTLRCYPNPARGLVNFDPVTERTAVRMFDRTGRMVLDTQLPAGAFQLAMSAVSAGMYVIQLTGLETGTLRTSRVVVE